MSYLSADPAVEVVLEVVPLGLGEAPAGLEVERQPAHLHQHSGLPEPVETRALQTMNTKTLLQ